MSYGRQSVSQTGARTNDSPAHTSAPAGAKKSAVIGHSSPVRNPVKNSITPADGGKYVSPSLFLSGMPMEKAKAYMWNRLSHGGIRPTSGMSLSLSQHNTRQYALWNSTPPQSRGTSRELPLSVSASFIYSFRLPPQGAFQPRQRNNPPHLNTP